MTLINDPRPASRYQAVTPSVFTEAMRTRGPRAGAEPAGAPKARVLRRVRAQLVHLALPG